MFVPWTRRGDKNHGTPAKRGRRQSGFSFLRPALERLEDRVVPATLDLVGGVLQFNNAAGAVNALTVSYDGTNYVFNDAADTIALGPGAVAATYTLSGGNHIATGPKAGVTDLSLDGGGDATDAVTLGGAAAFNLTGALSVVGFPTIKLQNDVTTGSNQVYNGAAKLGKPVITLNAGSVAFGGTVDGDAALVANSTGATTFAGPVGGMTALKTLTTDTGGTTSLKGVITTGGQSYNDTTVTLNGMYMTGDSDFRVANDALLGGDTGIKAGTGDVTFGGTVNGTVSDLFKLTVNSNGATTFGGAVGAAAALTSLTTDAVGTASLLSVRTTGAQTYNDTSVTLNGMYTAGSFSVPNAAHLAVATTTVVSTGAGAITFGTVDGDAALVANSTGATTFAGPVGGMTPLASLTTDAGGTSSLLSVTTKGAQTYGDDKVTLNGTYTTTMNGDFGVTKDAVLAGTTKIVTAGGGNVTFGGKVDGDADLIANSSGATTFAGLVGGMTALKTVTTDAGGTASLLSVTTKGAQTYGDDTVTLKGAYTTTMNGAFTVVNAATLAGDATVATGNGVIGLGTTLGNPGATVFVLTLNSAADASLATVIGGNVALTKAGSNTLTLTGANTYAGPTTVNAGTLANGVANALPVGTNLTVATLYDLNGFNQTVGSVTGAGTVTNGSGTAAAFTVNNAAPDTFAGLLSGNLGLVKGGAGALTLGSANTYTGATTVNAGALVNGAANALPTTTALVVAAGDMYDINGTTQTVASLSDSGAVTVGTGVLTVSGLLTLTGGTISSTGVGRLVLGGNVTTVAAATTASISGRVDLGGTMHTFTVADGPAATDLDVSALSGTGAAGVTKAGAGTMTLSGVIAYPGTTDVQSGTLLVNGSVSGPVTAESGATLGGTGTISGTVTVRGTLAPGGNAGAANPGILRVNNLAFAPGGRYTPEIVGPVAGTGYDQVIVSGTLDLGGATLAPILAGFVPGGGDVYTLLDNQGVSPVVGTFAGFAEGAAISLNGASAHITYTGGDGNDATLAVDGSLTYTVPDAADHILRLRRNGDNLQLLDNGVLKRNQPIAGVPSLTINGGAGKDNLTIDYVGGIPVPATGISFDGMGGSNSLNILGGAHVTDTYTYFNAHDGRISLDTEVINYTNLAPISNTGTAINAIFSVPAAAADVLLEFGGAANMSRLRGAAASFEATTFTNPTGSLALHVGGNNSFRVDATFDSGPGATQFNAALTVDAANDAVFVDGPLYTKGDLSLSAGALTLNNTVQTANGGTLTLTNAGLLKIANPIIADGAVTQNGAGAVTLGAPITTTGDAVLFNQSVTLSGSPSLDTTSGGSSGGAPITFKKSVDGGAPLTLKAGTGGDVSFQGAVGAATPLGAVAITGAHDLTAQAFRAASLTETGGSGTATLNGAVTTTAAPGVGITSNFVVVTAGATIAAGGAVSLTGTNAGADAVKLGANVTTAGQPVTFDGATRLTAGVVIDTTNGAPGGGPIAFKKSLDGAFTLGLKAGTAGDVSFQGAAGAATPLGAVTISGARNLTAQAFQAASLTETGGTGAATLNGAVTTTAAPGVGITSDTVILTTTGSIAAAGGGVTLTATNAGPDAVKLGGKITTAGQPITLDGAARLTAGPIALDTTSGSTAGAPITFKKSLDGSFDLTLTAGSAGDVAFNGPVGAVTPLGTITIPVAQNLTVAQTLKAASLIETNGTAKATINGAVTTSAAPGVDLTSNSIAVNASLSALGAGSVRLTAPAGIVLGGNVTTAGQPAAFAGAVTLMGAMVSVTTAGGAITFQQTLDGTSLLTLTAGATGGVSFLGDVGKNGPPLGVVTVVSARNLNVAKSFTGTALVETNGTGTATLSGPVVTTGAAGVALTSDTIVVAATAPITTTGGGGVVLTGANAVRLGANITTAGRPVTVDGAATLTANILIDTTNAGTATDGAAVTFRKSLGGAALTLDVTAGATGDVSFNDTVGVMSPALGAVTVSSAHDLTLAKAFRAASLREANGTGKAEIDGPLTTTMAPGVVLVSDTVVLAAAGSITASGGGAVTLTAANGVKLGSAITTAGLPVTVDGAVLLTNTTAVDTTSGGAAGADILFKKSLDGTQALTLTAGAGNVTLAANAGSTRLGDVTVVSAQTVTTQALTAAFLKITQTSPTATGTFLGDLDLNGSGLDLNGATFSSTKKVVVSGTFHVAVTGTATFSGVVSGSAKVIKDGAGTLTFGGANTYGGGTQVNAGTFVAGNSGALGTGAATFANGTTLRAASPTDMIANDLVFGAAAGDLTTIDAATNVAFKGKMTGNGGVILTNSGKVTFTADNGGTYVGPTILRGGVFEVDRLITSEVRLDAAATAVLEGVGTVRGIKALAGGTVQPGAAVVGSGVLTSTGSVVFNAATRLVYQVNGAGATPPPQPAAGTQYNQLVLAPGATADLGGANLFVTLGTPSAVDQVFALVKNNGGGAVAGAFGTINGAPAPAQPVTLLAGQRFQILYGGQVSPFGADVTFTHLNSQPTSPTISRTRKTPLLVPDTLSNLQAVETETVDVSGDFTDADVLDPHTVTINWGDGSPATTLALAAGVGHYDTAPVAGASHKYLAPQNATVIVTVDDGHGSPATQVRAAHDKATNTNDKPFVLEVLDAPLTDATSVKVTDATGTTTIANALLATFKDLANQDPSTFQVLVDWGEPNGSRSDSNATPNVRVSRRADGVYEVRADHTFSSAGLFRVHVVIISDGHNNKFPDRPANSVTDVCSLVVLGTANDLLANQPFLAAQGRAAPASVLGELARVDNSNLTPLVKLRLKNDAINESLLLDQTANQIAVRQLYCKYLGRPVDDQGLAFWTRYLAQVGTRQTMAALLIGSQEYFLKHAGSNQGFVTGLYSDYLGRTNPLATDGGVVFWTNLLDRGVVTRGVVAQLIVTSTEGNYVEIKYLYNTYLGRSPAASELAAWEGRLRQTSLLQISREILGSDEHNNYAMGLASALNFVSVTKPPSVFPAGTSSLVTIHNSVGDLASITACPGISTVLASVKCGP